ncbi:MAG: hypothetical protein ACREHD_16530 [Pirellulales bacterium]
MARDEQDREDLLAEATALVERAELQCESAAEPVVVGFRRDGSASVFFGADSAYHFNAANELRRAYSSSLLYKAERRRLVSLKRERVPGEVRFVRHELSDDEAHAFLEELARRLSSLHLALARGDSRVVRHVPESARVSDRVLLWLNHLSLPPPVAARPHASR